MYCTRPAKAAVSNRCQPSERKFRFRGGQVSQPNQNFTPTSRITKSILECKRRLPIYLEGTRYFQ